MGAGVKIGAGLLEGCPVIIRLVGPVGVFTPAASDVALYKVGTGGG